MLLVPEGLWDDLIKTFKATRRRIEQVAYLDGLEWAGTSLVTTVTLPNAELRQASYQVSPEAMSQAGKHLRTHKLVRVAQVHTHPGSWVDHSPEDDRRAYSQEVGALSIVLPNYGRGDQALGEIGFHIRRLTGWGRLSEGELTENLRFVPSFVDLRKR